MAQISQKINSTNIKNHPSDKISKIIVNLGSKKGDKNDDPPHPQLYLLQNSLLMIIFVTHEKYLSHGEGK